MRRLQNILPYEPGFTEHREIERRRRETREWLREREARAQERPSMPPHRSPPATDRAARLSLPDRLAAVLSH